MKITGCVAACRRDIGTIMNKWRLRILVLVLATGFLTLGLVLFAWHKRRSMIGEVNEIVRLSGRVVADPNDLRVTECAGGGLNRFGLGRFTVMVEMEAPSGMMVVLSFTGQSSVAQIRILEAMMTIRRARLDLRGYNPRELTEMLGSAKTAPIGLAEARTLKEEDWVKLAKSDGAGIVRIKIPVDRVYSGIPLVLHEAVPGLFHRERSEQ